MPHHSGREASVLMTQGSLLHLHGPAKSLKESREILAVPWDSPYPAEILR